MGRKVVVLKDRVVKLPVECKNKCHEKEPMYVECRSSTGGSQLKTWTVRMDCPQCNEQIAILIEAEHAGPIIVGPC